MPDGELAKFSAEVGRASKGWVVCVGGCFLHAYLQDLL